MIAHIKKEIQSMLSDHHKEGIATEHFQIEHDKVAKIGLKNKERFKALLKFKLSHEKFNALDFDQFSFMDTELLQKETWRQV